MTINETSDKFFISLYCTNDYISSDVESVIIPSDTKTHGKKELSLNADLGSYCTFRLDVFSPNKELNGLYLEYCDLTSDKGTILPCDSFFCINTDIVNHLGISKKLKLDIPKGITQTLWISLFIPLHLHPSLYTGKINVVTDNIGICTATINITVSKEICENFGDDNPSKLSRLRWLNSTRAIDDTITRPYTQIKVENNSLFCLGRKITLDDFGLPIQIATTFSKSVDELLNTKRNILSSPIHLYIEGKTINAPWETTPLEFIHISPSKVIWKSSNKIDRLTLDIVGSLEYDGYISYSLAIKSDIDQHINNIKLDIPFTSNVAKYAMGLGLEGGSIPEEFTWKWNSSTQQDSIWIGDINAGLQLKFKDEKYQKPFVNIYYRYRQLKMPEGWYNNGKGKITLSPVKNGVKRLSASTGIISIPANKVLHFNFDLLITPLKTIDFRKHTQTRYFHRNELSENDYSDWINNAKKAGANVLNVHHGNDLNPFINYPFIENKYLKDFVSEAHQNGIKVKPYYTIREISFRMHELAAFRSLGDEIFPKPSDHSFSHLWQGDAGKWVKENLGDDVIPAWKHEFTDGKYSGEIDAAILSDGTSRMANYYIEGLNWLVKNCNIDGIYVDDTDCDRNTLKRARKVLDSTKEGCLIDFHSWSHMEERAGTVNSPNLYMSLFPYMDSLWFGEGFDYSKPPEYWLVEICGIPYGMTSQMLEGGGNPWRGMLFGMTNRLGWSGNTPEYLWKLWDEFKIEDSKMLGFWDERCPVSTSNKDIYSTVYKKESSIMIALASWAKETVTCNLIINWDNAGLNPEKASICIPHIPNFQDQLEMLSFNDSISIEPGKGLILILTSKN